MIKCKSCGEINLDSSRFCVSCGKPLSDSSSNAMKEALEKAQKSFEKDALATIDRSRITFVCSVCGTVNSIDQDRCSKCGKPRPRSEFVSALKKVKQGYEYSEEATPEQQPVQEDITQTNEKTPPEEEAIQQPKQLQQPIVQTEGLTAMGGGQANPVVQPFIVVPFVNPNQEIWQYKPNQVFRFQPYSQEEIDSREMERINQEKAINEAHNLTSNYGVENIEKSEDDIILRQKTKPVRVVGLLLMILSLAMVILAYVVNIYEVFVNGFVQKPILFFVTGIGECVEGAFSIHLWDSIGYTYEGWTDFISPVAFTIFIILAVVLVIRSFARLLKGSAKRKGFLLPLFVLLFFLTGVVGIINKYAGFTSEGLNTFLDDVALGMYIIGGISLLAFLISFFSPSNLVKKRNKKDLD
jgi:ribosomal protein L37E